MDVCHRYCYETVEQKGITKLLFSLAHVKDFTAYLLQVFEQILEFKIFSVDSHNVCVSEHELKS